jgi:signal recognition particle GTPase
MMRTVVEKIIENRKNQSSENTTPKSEIQVKPQEVSIFSKAYSMINSNFIDYDVSFSIYTKFCTSIINQNQSIKRNQKMYQCFDCKMNPICGSCFHQCHKDHKTEYLNQINYMTCQCVKKLHNSQIRVY